MLIPNELMLMMREAVVRIPTSEYANSSLKEFVSLCDEAGVKRWIPTICTGSGGIVAIQVERPFDEERLSALDYVVWWKRIASDKVDVEYFLKLDVPGLPDKFPPFHELEVSNEEITVNGYGLDISFIGNQKAITQVIDKYIEADVPMELRAISEYRGSSNVLDSLTDRQREVVGTAYEMGYYEIPRHVSTTDIAAELELDQSTVSEHLQRAERNLLTHVLGSN